MSAQKKESGIVLLEPGKYRVSVRIRISGKIIERRETVNGSREQARDRRQQLKREIREGKPVSSLTAEGISTFNDVLSAYRERKPNLSVSHARKIEFIRREIGSYPVQNFAERLEKYLTLLRQSPIIIERPYGKVVLEKRRGPSSINRIVEIVRAAFNVCVSLDYLPVNPISKVRFPRLKEKPRDRYLTEDERQRLLNVVSEHAPYLFPMLQYALLVPSRVSELINLTRENYNMLTNTLYVPDSKAGIPIYKPIPQKMAGYFRNIPSDCPWIFYRQDESGNYHQLKYFRTTFKTCLRKAKIVNFRFHDTRHIAATDLYALGNPERMIMDIAGWKTPMLSTYRHKNSLQSAMKIKFYESRCEDTVKTSAAMGT
ncbi:MAG: tyrosine-type recombinase/integrase [Chitinivibrionales bacterium]|nr:tyrosine-type recombinase/integrase [Chitinivibrionales bacterium]